jgi:ATP-dependent RNA helicase DeaD
MTDTSRSEQSTTFADLGLGEALLGSLDRLGYEEPTPIQRETIPLLLSGADVLGQAATGTGKTAAFALPILEVLGADAVATPTALVLCPTRELAVQVAEAFTNYGRPLRVQVLAVFGGQPIGRQLKELKRGVHIVVGTPGRVLDHIGRGSLDLDGIRTVVLDEADEMMDMGFADDLEAILDSTPTGRQTVLFSATMPKRIAAIARSHQQDPVRIEIGRSAPATDDAGVPLVREAVYWVRRHDKAAALGRILDIENPNSTLVFCRTRNDVDELTVALNARGYRAEALHGGMDQVQRDRVMERLRSGIAELLVATDVAARGLDVDALTHVVNFEIPSSPESYVHRIGRVGRAGREGTALTLATPNQRRQLQNIERLTKRQIPTAAIPTVADLRARQVELTVEAITESLAADDLDDHGAILDQLADEDAQQVALAAIRLVHQARGATMDEPEIPSAEPGKPKDSKGRGGKGGSPPESARRGGPPRQERGHGGDGTTGFVFIGAGRNAGMRPKDLVGSIANESGLAGRDIGPIRISATHSVVGVPEARVADVIAAMRTASIRGRTVQVRRFME